MAVLRELVSRFSFETDKKSVANYNKTIGGMKSSAKGLAGILGVGFGAKGMFGLGVQALTAEENLKKVAGVDFNKVGSSVDILRNKLNGIREGVGDLIKDKEVNVLAAGYIKNFDSSSESLSNFIRLLESATIESAVTRKSISEIFSGFQGAVTGGDIVGGLLGVGELNLRDVSVISDILELIDAKEIGGEIGRQQKLNEVLKTLSSVKQKQIKQLQGVSNEFLEIQVMEKELSKFADDVSETATVYAVKTASALLDALKLLPENIKKVDRIGVGEEETGNLENIFGIFNESGRKRLKERLNDFNPFESRKEIKDGLKNGGAKVDIKTTFNINGVQNPKEISEIINKDFSSIVEDASNQIIRQEVR